MSTLTLGINSTEAALPEKANGHIAANGEAKLKKVL